MPSSRRRNCAARAAGSRLPNRSRHPFPLPRPPPAASAGPLPPPATRTLRTFYRPPPPRVHPVIPAQAGTRAPARGKTHIPAGQPPHSGLPGGYNEAARRRFAFCRPLAYNPCSPSGNRPARRCRLDYRRAARHHPLHPPRLPLFGAGQNALPPPAHPLHRN